MRDWRGIRAKRESHCLDFVTDKQHIVLRAQFPNACKVARGRNDDAAHLISKVCHAGWRDSPSLALNGLDQERRNMFSMEVQCALEILDNTIADGPNLVIIAERRPDTLEIRTKASTAIRIGAHA